jgi:hypothetical protein
LIINILVSNPSGQIAASLCMIVQRGIGAMTIGSTFRVAPPRGLGTLKIGSTFKVS